VSGRGITERIQARNLAEPFRAFDRLAYISIFFSVMSCAIWSSART
jgi:hypothetical protein